MSSTAFGEHLKREREMRGVSLEEIAAATRINTRFLEAIENERWDLLPGGVFNRGFIRSIARYLGMDEDTLVAEYDLGAQSNGHGNAHSTASITAQSMGRDWRPAAVAIAILILLIGTGIFAYVHYGKRISGGIHQGAAAIASQVHRFQGTGHGSSHPADSHANSASVYSNSATASAPLTLQLEAGKPANVKVVADGSVVFQGPVKVNDVKKFQAHNEFQVTSSESSALLLELDGQTVPPIGTPGQPGSVTLTRSDLTPSSGDSH
ncbi:MAG: RodZ domain-containing protein [Candidatus Acidiferrales bacterium]